MPHFYFDVTEGFKLEPDEIGLELKDIEDAETTAMHVAAEFCLDRLPATKGGRIIVEVRDTDRQMLMSIRLTMGSERFVSPILH